MSKAIDRLAPTAQNSDVDGGSYVFTTVLWDPILLTSAANTAASCNRPCSIYMLEHHWTRLQVAKWSTSLARSSPAELLFNFLRGVKQWHANNPGEQPEALRIKLRWYAGGKMTTEISRTARVPMERLFPASFGSASHQPPGVDWTITLDDVATEASATTMYKTHDRCCYDRAREVAKIRSYLELKEVLLYNTDSEVLDGTLATPYFWRYGQWVTPGSASGGQQGTTRRWALEKSLCSEDVVMKDELQVGEIIWLSNAVKGYYRARLVANPDAADQGPDH